MQNEDKDNIIDRLQELQRQQTHIQQEQNRLIQQLKNLNIQENKESKTEKNNEQNEDHDADEFHLGEYVKILNPGAFQEKFGTICNLGNARVTVLTKIGRKIVRAPFNLRKEKRNTNNESNK